MNGTTIPVAGVTKPAETLLRQVIVVKSPLRGRPPTPRQSVSREAQRIAAALLEVLAGVRTPTDAAAALNISIARYYLWEKRALEGFVSACEPRPPGEYANHQHGMAILRKEVVRLRQDCTRQQALVRASQRTIGLAPPPQLAQKSGKKATGKAGVHATGKLKRKRRPMAQGAEGSGGTAGQSRHGGATGSFVFSDPGRSGTTD